VGRGSWKGGASRVAMLLSADWPTEAPGCLCRGGSVFDASGAIVPVMQAVTKVCMYEGGGKRVCCLNSGQVYSFCQEGKEACTGGIGLVLEQGLDLCFQQGVAAYFNDEKVARNSFLR